MIVLVFLKSHLAGRWNADMLWTRVRGVCALLIRELQGKHSLPAMAMWEGVFDPYEGFPDMSLPPYAGPTTQATVFSAVRQLRYYLLEQPFDEATKHYIDVLKDPRADAIRLRKAREFHDGFYRRTLVPTQRFFLHNLAPPGSARRFVDVAFEYLETSHTNLQHQFLQHIPCSKAHSRSDSHEYLLRML